MKNSLKITALSVVTGFVGLAFAEILGPHVSAVLSLEHVAVLFSLLLISLTVISDYSRRVRPLRARSTGSSMGHRRETHRLAA